MVSSEQEEELESLSYLYTEEELIILSNASFLESHTRSRSHSHTSARLFFRGVWKFPHQGTSRSGMGSSYLSPLMMTLEYPHEKPKIEVISMDLKQTDKDSFVDSLLKSCDDCMDMAMTFVLSSALSELLSTIHEDKLSRIKDTVAVGPVRWTDSQNKPVEIKEEPVPVVRSSVQEPKTKAQKRREQNNWQKAGELPRGYNWVDVLNHLRKTASD